MQNDVFFFLFYEIFPENTFFPLDESTDEVGHSQVHFETEHVAVPCTTHCLLR